jgi:2-polyprenyl-6-methoxyphenol hydroxylase-like FAD-dependent oxidoreductase
MRISCDVAIVGGGIAGAALATILARSGIQVVVLEREFAPVDRVRGEYIVPWGVVELHRLGLLAVLEKAGGLYARRGIPYSEDLPGEAALPFARDLTNALPEAPGAFCMSHPAMCATLAAEAEKAGATFLRGVDGIELSPGTPPTLSFRHAGPGANGERPELERQELRPRLVVGADGRNSQVRRLAGIPLLADPPHHLIGGMLVSGVPEWPADTQVIGNEGRAHYLIFPQRSAEGETRLRLYLCYDFADKAAFQGPARRENVLATFGRLTSLPYAGAIGRSQPIGPFNSFSNEDHWTEDPTAPGIVLIGDAAGHNDPIGGQGLSIALRDVRLVSEIILAGGRDRSAFRDYAAERVERMRRLRIAMRLLSTLRVEFGAAARTRRQVAARRMIVEKMLSPAMAALLGPEALPAKAFEPATIEALLA